MGTKNGKMIWLLLLVLSLLLAGCGSAEEPGAMAVEEAGAELSQESGAPAAEAETAGVTFEGISFSYDTGLAGGVSPQQIPAAAETENAPTWAVYPAHVQFTFNDYLLETPINQPRLYVYPVNQYKAISETAAGQIDRLQQLLEERPEAPEEDLPLLPLFNANQVIHPQVAYLTFQNGTGLRFLTQYSQAMGPINNNELFYTFQGLTTDGAYYISAIFPVAHPSLPADASAIPGGDLSTFESNFETYRVETMQQLSQAPLDSFNPALTRLDSLVESISITSDPTAQAHQQGLNSNLIVDTSQAAAGLSYVRLDGDEYQATGMAPRADLLSPQEEEFEVGASGQLESGVRYRNMMISLDREVETKAQLTFPATGEGPWPVVILIPGAGAQDMDATYPASGQAIQSTNYKLLANELSQAGLAVLRFHRRGVLGGGQYDPAQLHQAHLNQLMADVDEIIASAKVQPEINPAYLFLYGWGEGAQVAAQVARKHPGLAGLILQAPPSGGPEGLLTYQHLELGLPFLKAEIDRDGDGRLNPAELATIPPGPAQAIPLFYIWASGSTPEQPHFQEGLDRNGDGLIDLDQELRPWMALRIPQFARTISQNSPTTALDGLVQASQMPILILQGGKDGWVPPTAAEALAARAPGSITLKQYPRLGHALSLTTQPVTDEFGVMAQEPVDDVAGWVHEVVRRSIEIMLADFG